MNLSGWRLEKALFPCPAPVVRVHRFALVQAQSGDVVAATSAALPEAVSVYILCTSRRRISWFRLEA
jgi:hypothetical protein